jgi:hypothetical protein
VTNILHLVASIECESTFFAAHIPPLPSKMIPSDFTSRIHNIAREVGREKQSFLFGRSSKRALQLSDNLDEFVNKCWSVGTCVASEAAAHLCLDDFMSQNEKGVNAGDTSVLTKLMDALGPKWNASDQLRVKVSFMGETRTVGCFTHARAACLSSCSLRRSPLSLPHMHAHNAWTHDLLLLFVDGALFFHTVRSGAP